MPVAPSSSVPAPSSSRPEPGPTTPAPTGWGPSQAQLEAARDAVARMGVAEKAGQVFVDFYTGTDPAAELALARRVHLGGMIVMGDNLPRRGAAVDAPALRKLVARFQRELSAGRDWPAMIGVDQEGGQVQRVKAPLTEWPSPMAFGAADDPELTRDAQAAMDAELRYLGFTANFSPDADVTSGPSDPTIGARSYGSSPALVAEHAAAAVEGALSAGVLPSAKHFPGHGSVTTDSHLDLPVQEASVAQLRRRDWVPFTAASSAGTPMVMMGHIAVPALEPGVPSSLSAASYAALRELGFEGVAVTDALNMGAVTKKYPGGEAAVRALAAGADLLLMPQALGPAHAAVVKAVSSGRVPEARLDEAATRVVAMMMWQEASGGAPARPGSGAALSLEASRAAVTVVSGKCSGPLVSGGVRISGGSETDRARLAAAARAAGLRVGSGSSVVLLGSGGVSGNGDVVVSLDAPWGLASSSARTARVALYGRTPQAFRALAEVLAGTAEATGKLPADVGRFKRGTGCG